MKNKHLYTVIFTFMSLCLMAQSKKFTVKSFKKIIISPHIEVEFKKGDNELVEIIENHSGLNIDVKGKTLHLYLNDAKISSPTKKIKVNGHTQKVPIYKETLVKAIITYKNVETFALRGEQDFLFKSPIVQDKLTLNIYGEPDVTLENIELKKMKTTLYGAGKFSIAKGKVDEQKYTVYGEARIKVSEVKSNQTKVLAYGDANVKVNVSERLKVTSYGEAKVYYKGSPKISKGIIIGSTIIEAL
ncbi:hypothetical protein WH52_00975 [Tenacibaculum holothuriorum]|uniref:Putative auto-transporter adhesin head GIN domain-containing protein n=1 Tax=Tenacibaculum holothuriorum TaxID=1635173 RepID=A0A1Y2PGX7_9FLAO|nr:head GIN domain-containing protein [Tenacibaculum holothuriorum]OSY89251.1 hypothetical protein WH52_00975 [Tenacibaculum holothuriorum]